MTLIQSIRKARILAGTVMLAVMGTVSPVLANWIATGSGLEDFLVASACAPGPSECVNLACLMVEGGGFYWSIFAPEPGYTPQSTDVTWAVDNRRFTLTMTKAGPAENGMQDYDAVYDPVGHQSLVQSLKQGNRLTVSSDQFSTFTLSLRGSNAALTRVLAECPLANMAATATVSAQPMDPVKALMISQDCKATEDEIFKAITGAGFTIWDANQFVVRGSEDGTLQLLDKTDSTHTYRLPDCKAEAKTQPAAVVRPSIPT